LSRISDMMSLGSKFLAMSMMEFPNLLDKDYRTLIIIMLGLRLLPIEWGWILNFVRNRKLKKEAMIMKKITKRIIKKMKLNFMISKHLQGVIYQNRIIKFLLKNHLVLLSQNNLCIIFKINICQLRTELKLYRKKDKLLKT